MEELHLMLPVVQPDLGIANVVGVRVGAIPGGHHHGAVPPHGEFVAVGACHHRQAPRLGPGVHFRGHHHHGSREVLALVLRPVVLQLLLLHVVPQVRLGLGVLQQRVQRREREDPLHLRAAVRVGLRHALLGLGRLGAGGGRDVALGAARLLLELLPVMILRHARHFIRLEVLRLVVCLVLGPLRSDLLLWLLGEIQVWEQGQGALPHSFGQQRRVLNELGRLSLHLWHVRRAHLLAVRDHHLLRDAAVRLPKLSLGRHGLGRPGRRLRELGLGDRPRLATLTGLSSQLGLLLRLWQHRHRAPSSSLRKTGRLHLLCGQHGNRAPSRSSHHLFVGWHLRSHLSPVPGLLLCPDGFLFCPDSLDLRSNPGFLLGPKLLELLCTDSLGLLCPDPLDLLCPDPGFLLRPQVCLLKLVRLSLRGLLRQPLCLGDGMRILSFRGTATGAPRPPLLRALGPLGPVGALGPGLLNLLLRPAGLLLSRLLRLLIVLLQGRFGCLSSHRASALLARLL
mmetsp:Transcript_29820/g.71002  ORF Transcript_29820/g.71002 Transcript_29820/m.71002 type:complete len:509 (+) Transcript_29820:1455-2981(+)